MSLSKEEQATIILFDNSNNLAEVYTHDRALKRKLASELIKSPSLVKFIRNNDEGGETYLIPKKYISVKIPKIQTDEERSARAEVMKMNAKKKSK